MTSSDERQPSRIAFALHVAQRAIAELLDDRGPQLAAAIAYHVLFSIFPLAIFLTAVFSLVARATGIQGDVVDSIVRNVPLSAGGSRSLRHTLEGATSGWSALGLLGILGLLWAASGMMAAVRTALNAAWDVEQPRPFLKGKLLDLGLVFVVALGALATVVATILANSVGSSAPWLLGVAFPLAYAFVAVFLLYRLIPPARVATSPTWIVALGVAVGFVLAEHLFAVYFRNVANYNAVYGSLGAVIAFMFFVYVSSFLFLLGAEVASEWPRARRAFAAGEVEEGPPFKVQLEQFARGLWVRERSKEARREQRPRRAPARQGGRR